MNNLFSKIGFAKTTVKYAWFCFFVLVILAAVFFKQVVWAEDVDISAYSGWCLGNITGVSGGYTYVDLALDQGMGCVKTASYAGTVKFNNCDFQYNCGPCSGGSQTCTYAGSYVPSPYACTVTPATTKTQACTNPLMPPVIDGISTPTAGAIITASYQPITFSYHDDVKVASVEIYDGATLLTTMTINNASGSTYYNWQTSTVTEGPHTIKLIAYDDESTPSAAFTRDVVIDFNPPTIVLTSPSAAGAIIIGPFTISASASDVGSGIKEVKFYLDSTTNQLGSALTATPYSYYWDSTATANGDHKIYAYATDNAGRINYTYFNVTVNNPVIAGPTVVFTNPVIPAGAATVTVDNTTNISVSVTAGSAPVSSVQFYLDSTTNKLGPTLTATPYIYAWDTKNTANGDHTIYAVATDTAGITGSPSQPLYVHVYNPVVSTGSGGGSTTVTCTYTCSEWGACTAEGKQSCLNFTHTPTTGTCSEAAPTSKTQNCTYTPPITTGTIIVKNKVVNDGGGTKEVSDFKFSVNGGTGVSFNNGGENDLKKNPGTYTITVAAVENYVTTYEKCSNIDLAVGQTVTCTVTNTYKVPVVAQVKCDYACNKWGDCSTLNIETCVEVVKTPAGCLDYITVPRVRDCQYKALAQECVFTCSEWGECTSEGKKVCLNHTHTPANVSCSNAAPSDPVACEYAGKTDNVDTVATSDTVDITMQTAAADTNGAGTEVKNSGSKDRAVECDYTYSAYGACVNNKQVRIVLSKSPDNCQESVNPPDLEEDCDSSKAEAVVRPQDAPVPVPEAVTAVGANQAQENKQLNNYNGRTSGEWQKYYFGSEICADAAVCGGDADPDNDGLSNNEEYRFGTNPRVADTDGDGRIDGAEIQERRDPLTVSGAGTGDQMVFEDPKASSAGNEGIYEVTNVETIGGEKGSRIVKLSGKALPNTYINLVIFSEPIVMTVKTNEDGSWSYVLDRPLPEGDHEVYVVATSNIGKIAAKSDAFGFVQTAEAAVAKPSPRATVDRAPAPTKARAGEGYLLLGLFSLLGVSLAVVAIGLVRGKSKNDQQLQ